MKGIRQAALCLHGLNEHDRKWLLKQLPSAHRNALTGMLRELNQIGVPRGHSWVPTVKKRTVGNEHDPDLSTESIQIITVIDSASISQIKHAIFDEPEVVLAAILSIYKWSWKDDFVDALSVKKRRLIDKLAQEKSAHPLNTVVAESILAIVLDKLRGKYQANGKNANRGKSSLYLGDN